MANSKSVSFNVSSITKLLVALLLIFMGISGFISTRGTAFTAELFDFLDEDAFIYIVSALVAIAGLGLICANTISGMPAQIGTVSGIVAIVFWILVIVFKDITTLGDVEFVDFVQSVAVDAIILIAILESTVGSKK